MIYELNMQTKLQFGDGLFLSADFVFFFFLSVYAVSLIRGGKILDLLKNCSLKIFFKDFYGHGPMKRKKL